MNDIENQFTETVTTPYEKLSVNAEAHPYQKAAVYPEDLDKNGRIAYTHLTFEAFKYEVDILAQKMDRSGIKKGMRMLYMVRPGIEYLTFIYAIFKIGAIPVLMMPGLDKKKTLACIKESDCHGMIGPVSAHFQRIFNPKCYQSVKKNIRTENSIIPIGMKINTASRKDPETFKPVATVPGENALIIYSPGNQGLPNGVIYKHKNLDGLIRNFKQNFNFTSGKTVLSLYPVFSIFHPALDVTSVIPDTDPDKILQEPPLNLVRLIQDQGVTNIISSPSLLERIGKYCNENKITLSSLKNITAFGTHVLPSPLEEISSAVNGNTTVDSKYGTLETLSISSITSDEILTETAKLSNQGYGTCLGVPFEESNVNLVKISDAAISKWSDDIAVFDGDVGEIIITGESVSPEYFENPQEDTYSKIYDDNNNMWHRTGDLAWRDKKGRMWYCGKKNHRVTTKKGPLFTINCEAIFNSHCEVKRCALIGIGAPNDQTPIICIELKKKLNKKLKNQVMDELLSLAKSSEATKPIENVIFVDALPVDAYHQSKILRTGLSKWAESKFLNHQEQQQA